MMEGSKQQRDPSGRESGSEEAGERCDAVSRDTKSRFLSVPAGCRSRKRTRLHNIIGSRSHE